MTKLTKSILNRLARTGINNQSAGQKLISNLKLDEDEFTKHSSVRQLTLEFLQSATDFEYFYQGGKKKLVVEFAAALEEDLKRNGQDELVCEISSFIIKLVEQAELGWSDDYLRRVLDDKYKDPISQASALKRKPKSKSKQKTLPELKTQGEIEEVKRLREENKNLKNQIENSEPQQQKSLPEPRLIITSQSEKLTQCLVCKKQGYSYEGGDDELSYHEKGWRHPDENRICRQLEEFEIYTDYVFTLSWKSRKDFEKLLNRKVKSEYIDVAGKDEYNGRFALEIHTPVTVKVDVKAA